MRLLLLFISAVICAAPVVTVHAAELEQAYQKEYAYLVAEKKALQQRLSELKRTQSTNLRKVKAEIDAQQRIFLGLQNKTDQLNINIADASRNVDFAENDVVLLETTLIQAGESLEKLGTTLDEAAAYDQRLKSAFSFANTVIRDDGQLTRGAGRYYLPDGEAIDGDIIKIGRIARFGLSEQGGGALAPAGAGQFKVWDEVSLNTARLLHDGQNPETLDIFLYENTEKGVEKRDEKTFSDDVSAGGLVGKIIIALGLVGIALVIARIVALSRAGVNVQKVSGKVNDLIKKGELDQALEMCKQHKNAACKVIAATVRNLNRDRDHIEDIISESILHESSYIDRFGAAILVIAAISPLLGLLGTVTGMISTFDIITEFGTGDPKLLSSGISEALLTTKFGLVVAIPMLLVGNLLSAWARGIKSDLEQAALHMINTHKLS